MQMRMRMRKRGCGCRCGCGSADAETRMQMRMRKRGCGCGPDDEGALVPRRFALLEVTGNNRDDGLFRGDQLSLYDASIRFAHRQSLFIYLSFFYLYLSHIEMSRKSLLLIDVFSTLRLTL